MRTHLVNGNGKPLSRRDWLKAGGAALASLGSFQEQAVAASRRSETRKRVLVLGIDGMSPDLLRQYVARGLMPNFARLIRHGGFQPLRTTNPPQSPVAWSSFITGMNPGGHGIYDFIHRDPKTLAPCFSTSRILPPSAVLPIGAYRLPLWGGGPELLRRGPAFWRKLSQHGVPCTLYRLPSNFPPVECNANTLSGLGTPDILGGYGVSSYVADVAPPNLNDLEDVHVSVVDMSKHRCQVSLVGPENTLRKRPVPVQVTLDIVRDPVNPVARIAVQGREILLRSGEWSDWVRVRFDMLPLLASASGICRFFLKEVHPHLRLYVSPINIDPADPAMPISTPGEFARQLAQELGPYYTQGIAEDTKALSHGLFDDKDYLQQAMFVLEESLRAYQHLLRRFDRGLLFFYFSSIDLNCHMFWRSMDPRHPLYTPELSDQYGKTIENLYVRMDAVLGQAAERIGDDGTLIVLSDHGFQPFYRVFSQNSWLLENGYARLIDPRQRDLHTLFANTDWEHTYAYGLGINSLYLNLRGREKCGVVSPGRQADTLIRDIAGKLQAEKDPKTGQPVFSHVYRGSDIYRGQCASQAPDLVLGYNHGYRASWKTILGAYETDVIADNRDCWSGDHCMDVEGLSGVLLSNKRIAADHPALTDLSPTILAEFGLDPTEGSEGKVVLEQTS